MTQELHRELARWLRTEAEGQPDKADKAFRRAFRHVPVPMVSADFSQRVMTSMGLPVSTKKDIFAQSSWRWAFATLFAAVGILVGLMPAAASGIGWRFQTGQVIDLFQGSLTAMVRLLAGAAGWLDEWLALPGLTLDAASSPLFLTAFFVMTLISLVVLRWVTDLTLRGTGVAYVDAT